MTEIYLSLRNGTIIQEFHIARRFNIKFTFGYLYIGVQF